MQGFGYNGRRLYRYKLIVTTTEYGSTEQTYVRENRQYWVNVIPSTHTHSKMESGIVANTQSTAIINDTKDFKVGDRLGSEDEMLYEVIGVSTFATNQQLEVRECQLIP